MTITVVRGLLGKPVEVSSPSQDPKIQDPKKLSQIAQQAVTLNKTGAQDAVTTSITSSKSVERERLDTFSKAKDVSEDVKNEILESPDDAADAHKGLSSVSGTRAYE